LQTGEKRGGKEEKPPAILSFCFVEVDGKRGNTSMEGKRKRTIRGPSSTPLHFWKKKAQERSDTRAFTEKKEREEEGRAPIPSSAYPEGKERGRAGRGKKRGSRGGPSFTTPIDYRQRWTRRKKKSIGGEGGKKKRSLLSSITGKSLRGKKGSARFFLP